MARSLFIALVPRAIRGPGTLWVARGYDDGAAFAATTEAAVAPSPRTTLHRTRSIGYVRIQRQRLRAGRGRQ